MNLLERCKHETGKDPVVSSCTLGSEAKADSQGWQAVDSQGWQVVTKKKNRICTLQWVTEDVKTPEKMLTQVEVGGKQWEKIVFVADSGASETVIPIGALPGVKVTAGSKENGTKYKTAGGETMTHEGEKSFWCKLATGATKKMRAQVCATTRPLYSIAQCVKVGHRVVFDKVENGGSYIEHRQTGEKVMLKEAGGTYALEVEVAPF